MQRLSLRSFVKAGLCALLALGLVVTTRAEDAKVSPVGTWTFAGAGRNGNPGPTQTLKFKMDGDKLMGTISGGMGRRNANADAGATPAAPRETKLEEVKLAGDMITFKVTRAGRNGGAATVQKFSGKISGDSIKGKIEIEREGQDPRSNDWEAKRATETPAAPAAPAAAK